MFSSGSLSSISLATVTPSFVMVGEPNFFSSTTLRPFGPRVTLTALASWLTPSMISRRASSPYTICLAMFLELQSLVQLRAWADVATPMGVLKAGATTASYLLR